MNKQPRRQAVQMDRLSAGKRSGSCEKVNEERGMMADYAITPEISWSVKGLRSIFDQSDSCAQVGVSDAQANYPVVRPPPLVPYEPVQAKQRHRLQIAQAKVVRDAAPPSAVAKPPAGLVRTLAYSYESNATSRPKRNPESYVWHTHGPIGAIFRRPVL